MHWRHFAELDAGKVARRKSLRSSVFAESRNKRSPRKSLSPSKNQKMRDSGLHAITAHSLDITLSAPDIPKPEQALVRNEDVHCENTEISTNNVGSLEALQKGANGDNARGTPGSASPGEGVETGAETDPVCSISSSLDNGPNDSASDVSFEGFEDEGEPPQAEKGIAEEIRLIANLAPNVVLVNIEANAETKSDQGPSMQPAREAKSSRGDANLPLIGQPDTLNNSKEGDGISTTLNGAILSFSPGNHDSMADAAIKTLDDNDGGAIGSKAVDVAMRSAKASNDGSQERKTRYGSRISDDTSMLKDFLSRAQAKKAAKAQESAHNLGSASSPRRSPRKILGKLDQNSPASTKIKESISRCNTPPGKVKLGSFDMNQEVEETGPEPPSQRRSARKRPPAPSRTPKEVTPSLIPLRRPDGPEAIKLQKSAVQELAIVTRANTRRNKGQAKMPRVILESLASSESPQESLSKKRKLKAGKTVDWDETLVYYHETTKGKVADEKPKMKRERGLGTVNGTPAGKKSGPDGTGTLLERRATPGKRTRGTAQ